MQQTAQSTKLGNTYHLGGLTDRITRHPGVYINCDSVLFEDQILYVQEQITGTKGLKVTEESLTGTDTGRPKLWMSVIYRKQKAIIEFFRKISYQEWQLDVSSKNGLSASQLDELANDLFERIAKPEAERNMDNHQLRMQY